MPDPDSPGTVTGNVNASAVVDKDGRIGTDRDELDWEWVSGWEFRANFGAARVDVAQPMTQEGGDAWWEITYDEDTPVVITEQVPDGYQLIDVRCQWSPDDMTVAPLSMTRDGSTISWTASVGIWFEHGFWCIFVNVVDAQSASPTLPPTDTATTHDGPGSDPWPMVLFGLAALIAGTLVVRSQPTARSRRETRTRSVD